MLRGGVAGTSSLVCTAHDMFTMHVILKTGVILSPKYVTRRSNIIFSQKWLCHTRNTVVATCTPVCADL